MTALDPSPRAAADLAAVRPGDDGDPLDVYARVVWNVLVEPGDGVAGALIRAYGAREALRVATSEIIIDGNNMHRTAHQGRSNGGLQCG